MATTAKGTPYVVSTDLVANYPTVSSDLATHIDAKLAYNAVSINAQTGTTYTFALADASEGKLVTASNAAASTYTVPPQSSVTWAAGAVLRILNQGAGTVTIAAGSGVTINGTPLTLAQYKGAAIQRTAADTWTFVPFSGGVGNADFSDAATGTYSSGGINYKYITFTASGTLTVTSAGLADVLVVASGGGGAVRDSQYCAGGGGAGQVISATSLYLSGSVSVTVGAGGAGASGANANGTKGNFSSISTIKAIGGGGGIYNALNVGLHGSGGQASTDTGAVFQVGMQGASNVGNSGGNGTGQGSATNSGGGGGGDSAVGGNGSSGTGGAGGAGTASSITNTSVTYGGGGGGGGTSTGGTGGAGGGGAGGSGTASGTNATANTGGGGGGSGKHTGGVVGGNGGSGIVIVRVVV